MNKQYFTEYNYNLMLDSEYKEDTVREEIIAPLINLLGYSVGSENKVIRSRSLSHPFLTVGSKSRKVTYIPDYLLEVKDRNVLVLDAKAPNENIISGKNVEQAYSYAIHPEIRTNLFSLCNGKEISIFTLSKSEPILNFKLCELDKFWNTFARILLPKILANPNIVNYYPDYGLHLRKLGIIDNMLSIYSEIHINCISKLDDENYSCSTTQIIDNTRFMQTFDFNVN